MNHFTKRQTENKGIQMKTTVKLFAILVIVFVGTTAAFADPATGWKQTAAGTYDYNDIANWVDGVVNGVFGSDLTLAGAQTITFSADTTIPDGLTIAYAGNYAMTFQSDGTGAKTLTLGGDITANVNTGANSAHIIFGSSTDDDSLVLDFGGQERTITASASQIDPSKIGHLYLYAKLTNGSVRYAGKGTIKIFGASDYADGTTFENSGYVYINTNGAFGTGTNTVADCGGNWPRMHSNVANTEVSNTWLLNGDFSYHGSALTLTGDLVIPAPIRFWAESDNLTIASSKFVDLDGNCAVGNFEKWGSKNVRINTPFQIDNTTITIGNGVWNQYGKLTGSNLTVQGNAVNSDYTEHLHLYAENELTGKLVLGDGKVYVYLNNANALGSASSIAISTDAVLCCDKYSASGISHLVTSNSDGVLALGQDETADFNLSTCPNLRLGANGADRTITGTVSRGDGGVLRIGGGGKSLILASENAISGAGVVEVRGNNVILPASNDFEGTVKIMNGNVLELKNADGALPNADIHSYGGTFYINSSGATGCRRAGKVHIHGGTFQYAGNKNNATSDSVDQIVLDVRDPSYGVIGGVCNINLFANGKTAKIHADTLTRANSAIWRMGGNINNNRLRVGGADGENTVQFTVGNAAAIQSELVGGGGEPGTTTVSVYPYGISNCGTYYDSLLTYGSTGFRALDYETEFATSITPGTVSQVNVRLPSGSIADITSDTTINSVFLHGSESKVSTYINGSGTLTLTSGVLVMGYHRNAKPVVQCAAVNFGSRPGVICYPKGKGSDWKSAFQGSAGAIFFQPDNSASTDSGGTGVTISGSNAEASTLTGDVVIHGYVVGSANGAFPGGANRTGNLFINGYGSLLDGDGFNGVFGVGNLYRNNDTIIVGADGSNGDFEGSLSSATTLIKNGAGRQRIGGVCTHTKPTTVNAGVLQVDGSFTASAVTVAENAALGGSGGITNTVTFADGAKLAVTATNDVASCLTVAGTVSSDGPVTVNATVASGKWQTAQCVLKSNAAITANFVKGDGIGLLELRNNDTELWATPKTSGLAVFIR